MSHKIPVNMCKWGIKYNAGKNGCMNRVRPIGGFPDMESKNVTGLPLRLTLSNRKKIVTCIHTHSMTYYTNLREQDWQGRECSHCLRPNYFTNYFTLPAAKRNVSIKHL